MELADGYLSSCSSAQLNLDVVLSNGQSFRWKKEEDEMGNCHWIGVVDHRVWKVWRHDEGRIAFRVLHNFQTTQAGESDEQILRKYLQLDVDLERLYQHWATKCEYFRSLLARDRQTFQGIRLLRQLPVEGLFAFICSANNNIVRITRMIEKLCELYGTRADIELRNIVDGGNRQTHQVRTFYDFPSIPQLANKLPGMEQQLRAAGFGYRAASIAKTVAKLTDEEWMGQNDGETWLNSLRDKPYGEAREKLLQLPGVGPKVADCICLMALGMHHVVPVDRHIYALTMEIYKPTFLLKNGKKTQTTKTGGAMTITKQQHLQIGEFYVRLFGEYAGWVQSILFSTRLKQFRKP